MVPNPGPSPVAAAPRPRPSRWRLVLGLAAVVLLLHALLLALAPVGVGDGWLPEQRPAALRVRHLVEAPAAVAPAVEVGRERPDPPKPAAGVPAIERETRPLRGAAAAFSRRARAPEGARTIPSAAAPHVAEAAAPEPPALDAFELAAADPADTPTRAEDPPEQAGSGLPPPAPAAASGSGAVFATHFSPPVVLHYELRRGLLRGRGELAWRPAGEHYTMSMQGTALSFQILNWTSEGGFDRAGIAPVRFVDSRRGKAAQAANFQRAKGLITFSGSPAEYPVVEGAQDRLSWMMQLPAIVDARPAAFRPGARVPMFVVGARGEGDPWVFEVVASEDLALPAGPVAGALHLRREPRRPYDTQVEVWLDPARSYWPVQVRLAEPRSGDSTEFLLSAFPPG
ncbi:MAG: DUF3108 domain-containing protein [Burkholderiales bacterium]|nr:DUF3108 domain-containing protein [Burkholderiales bacterium]